MRLEPAEMALEVRRRHLRLDAHFSSPLPNLRLERGAAVAELIHHSVLEPMNGSSVTGRATLRLRGDELRVRVTADRPLVMELRRFGTTSGRSGRNGADLLLVARACGASPRECESSASFDLSMRDNFADLRPEELAQFSQRQAEAIGSSSVQGLPTRGWLAALSDSVAGAKAGSCDLSDTDPAPPEDGDATYFLGRINEEIRAALRAEAPGVASRHVHLATLMARRVQDGYLQSAR